MRDLKDRNSISLKLIQFFFFTFHICALGEAAPYDLMKELQKKKKKNIYKKRSLAQTAL